MELARRELLVARIVAGYVRFTVDGIKCSVRQGGSLCSFDAAQIYADTFEEAFLDGVLTDEDCLLLQKKLSLWDDEREKLLEQLAQNIDDFKVELYRASLRVGEKRTIKKALNAAREERSRLQGEKQSWSHLTCAGLAYLAKLRYQAGETLLVEGKKIDDFWHGQFSHFIDGAVDALTSSRLNESDLRDLARNEPWLSTWSVRGACKSVLPSCASELTDEQKQLLLWTQFYENAQGAQDCPPEEVFDDDDSMDGWAILRRREAQKNATQRRVDSASGDKIKSSQEVFLPANNADEARKISELNSEAAARVKKQLLTNVAQKGRLEEHERSDVIKRAQMEALSRG